MAQRQYPVGTVLTTPFGTRYIVTDPNQFFSEQYVPFTVTSTPTPSAPPPPAAPVPTTSPTARVTVYSPYGDAQTIMASDLSYWQGQGWSTTRPAPRQQTTPPPTEPKTNLLSNPPPELANNSSYKSLSDDEKTMVNVAYNAIVSGNEAAVKDAQAYLAKAKELADPYYRSLVNVALDELERSKASTKADLEYRKKSLDDKIARLQEDLSFNRDKLTLDEQAEMSSQLLEYQKAKEANDFAMQEAGLTFSSPRKLAEQRLASAQDITAQSTARKYATLRREQELEVRRKAEDIARERELAIRQAEEAKKTAERAIESKVGSSVMPAGTSALGGVTGTIEESRKSAILDLEQVLKNREGEVPKL